MKLKIRSCIIILFIFTLTGCTSITPLTARENDIIGEYAAGVLLKYDKNYNNRLLSLLEIEQEQVLEEVDWEDRGVEVEQEVQTEVATVSTLTPESIEKTLKEALKTEKVNVNYERYFVVDSYPEVSPEDVLTFTMKATEGYKLLVLEFSFENPTDDKVTENILSKALSFNIMINKELRANSQLTMLLDDLSSFNEEIEANSIKNLVLIFQIPNRYENEDLISSMVLNIKDENVTSTIILK